jgi:hypothetical protein
VLKVLLRMYSTDTNSFHLFLAIHSLIYAFRLVAHHDSSSLTSAPPLQRYFPLVSEQNFVVSRVKVPQVLVH